MNESNLIPKNLTYESARNLSDLEKLEKMEILEDLEQEIEFLTGQLQNFKRIFRKEQKIRIYNDIQDDDMYKELNTQRSPSEEDINKSFENTSIILGPMDNLSNSHVVKSVMGNSLIKSHIIRNKSRSDFLRKPSRSMIFDEDENTKRINSRRKISEYYRYPAKEMPRVRNHSVIVGQKVVRSVRNYTGRGIKRKLLMNSGLSPQVGLQWVFKLQLDAYSKSGKEDLDEVLKKYIALNNRIADETRVRKKTKKPAMNALFNIKKDEFDKEFISLNCEIQIIKAQNNNLLDEIKFENEKINQITQEINIKNVTKSDFTRRLSQLNLGDFKLTN